VARRPLTAGGGASSAGRSCTIARLAAAALVVLLPSSPALAQSAPRCRILCTPSLKVEPTLTVEDLVQRPTIETLEDGRVVGRARVDRESVFELIFALDVPTEIPRLSLTLEAIFIPFGRTPVNPFTGEEAGDAVAAIRDNGIEIESELNLHWLEEEHTGGWVSSHVDIVDKFSPAAAPRAGSVYTHKLNLEWDTAFHLFNRLPDRHWLRNVELEVSLDYVATGLPKAGDVVGDERFLQKASPWSLSLVMVVPLAPLAP
jgi:hypothetical protein